MNENVTFESLSGSAKTLSAMIIMGAADFVFKLWPDGEIADVMINDDIRSATNPEALRHQQVQSIVLPEYEAQLSSILRGACRGQSPSPIKVRHSDVIRHGSSALYSAHLFGDGRNVMLIGKSLSPELVLTQQAASAEIARSLSASCALSEERYQHLFSASPEGLLTVDPTGLIEDANANAQDILACPLEDLVGSRFTQCFQPNDQRLLTEMLDRAGDGTECFGISASVSETGRDVTVSCRVVRSLPGVSLFVRIKPVDQPEVDEDRETRMRTVELLRKTGTSVLLTDNAGCVTWANDAFRKLLPSTDVLHQNVSDLLGIPNHTFDVIRTEVDQRGRILTSLTALSGALDSGDDAHLWLIRVPSEDPAGYGIILRPLPTGNEMPDTVEPMPEHSALAELVGQAPMKKLVRRSTTHIERSCIQAALRLTGNNRAAAASALGLSRQSLYLKMRQLELL